MTWQDHRHISAFKLITEEVSSTGHQPEPSPAPGTQRPPADLYTILLLGLGNGYPQWIPEPDVLLSGHEENGVSIGDVGIVDPSRSFDFLFNICNPSNALINFPLGLPPGTEPIHVKTDDRSSQSVMWSEKTVLSSGTMVEQIDTNSSRFVLKCLYNEGALLVLPEGASREDLKNINPFRSHAVQHGLAWYKHAEEVCGRYFPNGSLYLVTGHDKSLSWGLTSFSATSGPRTVSIDFNPTSDLERAPQWTSSGCATFRRSNDRRDPRDKNQCVFLRGFTISKPKRRKGRAGPKVCVEDIKGLHYDEIVRGAHSSTYERFNKQGMSSNSGSHGSSQNGQVESVATHVMAQFQDSYNDSDASDYSGTVKHVGADVQSVPGLSQFRYPSIIINEWMLAKVPNAQVAVTHDYDWLVLMTDEDVFPPAEDELIRRVCDMYDAIVQLGGVFLSPKSMTGNRDFEATLEATSQLETDGRGDDTLEIHPSVGHEVKLGTQVLETRKKVLGEDHPDALISMIDRESTYAKQGRWPEAGRLEVQVMETRMRALGKDHPDTLISMNNLVLAYVEQGQWKEAEKLGVQAIETSKRVLGENHSDTLISMNNLATTYRRQGRWEEAEKIGVQAMETSNRTLGEAHHSTLISMINLASMYWKQGRRREAEILGVQAMETRKRMLGEEHPDTLISMNNLASTYRRQGRWEEAEELGLQVMEMRMRVLGEEHPDTVISMSNLASTYGEQGRWKEAEKLEVRVVDTRRKTLGEEHFDTLISMNNLARYRNRGPRDDNVEPCPTNVVQNNIKVHQDQVNRKTTSFSRIFESLRSRGKENLVDRGQ